MALVPKTLTSTGGSFPNQSRVSMNDHITAVFGSVAADATLTYCTPAGYNESTGFYGAWVAPDPASVEIDTGGATGGTFFITVNGVSTGTQAYNVSAVALTEVLRAMGYTATVTLDTGVYDVSFNADSEVQTVPTLTGDVASLTDGSGEAATVTAGASTYGLSALKGFIWPEEVNVVTTGEVHGEVMTKGRIDYRDIEPTVDSGDVAALETEIKRSALGRGLIVEGLPNIH